MALEAAPGRINFCPPVSPKLLISELQQYDLGIHLLPTENINLDETLPNKIFEFIAACLPVVIGPAAGLKQIVEQYHIGIISPSFDPEQVAEIINRLDAAEIDQLKQKARLTRLILNADIEMKKLINLYTMLFNSCQ
jgi:glycosyltransferase involved in cell wall biosynthesis